MKKVMKYPIYPIAFSYVCGIFCGFYLKPSLTWLISIAILFLSVLLYAYFKKGVTQSGLLFNTCNFLALIGIFLSLGAISFVLNNRSTNLLNASNNSFDVRITEVLKANKYSNRFYGEVLNETNRDVLLILTKTDSLYKPGDVVQVFGSIKPIAAAKNLHDFSYQSYLANKQIHHQISTYVSTIKIGERPSFISEIIALRDFLIQRSATLNYDKKTIGFIEALLFGVKNNLDNSLQEQFKDFGIMHVLAVSGMHVLLIFKTFSFLLTGLRVPKKVTITILIAFLLLFTLMAGFSGSVVRAVLMCFMLILGQFTHKRISTINLLVCSMFLILLIAPNYLFDVGFQLSYLAVFSISFCYPLVQNVFSSKNYILNGMGQMVGVSIIAQLGVLPLSIYYFKQVPFLFLIGNIIAIPLTSILLISWFLQLFLSFVWMEAAEFITHLLQPIAHLTFSSIHYLNDFFVLKTLSIHWNVYQAGFASILIFVSFWFFYKKDISKIYIILATFIGFQMASIYTHIHNQNVSRIVVMSDAKQIVFLNHQSKEIQQIGTSDGYLEKSLLNYALTENATISQQDSLHAAFELNSEKWILIDSLGIYPTAGASYVLLHNKAKVNMERLVHVMKPKCIVFHNSMPEYLVHIYSAYCDKRKIPYHDMRTKGAYILNYNLGNN